MAYEKKIPVDLDCPLRLTMSLIESKWNAFLMSCVAVSLNGHVKSTDAFRKPLPEC